MVTDLLGNSLEVYFNTSLDVSKPNDIISSLFASSNATQVAIRHGWHSIKFPRGPGGPVYDRDAILQWAKENFEDDYIFYRNTLIIKSADDFFTFRMFWNFERYRK